MDQPAHSSSEPADQDPAATTGRPARETRTPGLRYVYIALGWLFVGLGVIGAVLPVMPTTIFLLAALWAFARGSRRFHDWLYTHPRFGAPLQAWDRHRVIRPAAKTAAILTMAASVLVVWLVSAGPLVPAVVAVVLAGVAIYILTRPSRAPAER